MKTVSCMSKLNSLKAFGCHDVLELADEPSPRHLDYLDLLKASRNGGIKVDAVAEFQARPLLYVVNVQRAECFDENEVLNLQCMLANRGERAYLGILRPGQLDVYPINLSRSDLLKAEIKTIKQDSIAAPLFFQSIASGVFTLKGQPKAPDYVFKTIHDLMTRSSETLIGTYNLNPLDVLSFLGRALFFRFLWDRGIVLQDELSSVCPQAQSFIDCFSNVENSVATCRWLDDTFNGDMLPLSAGPEKVFTEAEARTSGNLFSHLQAILGGWKHVGSGAFQLTIDWGDLDFAHIPIGVLSQVYENFSRVWDSLSKHTSVYYTPKNIARYLVDDAFEALTDKKHAKVLDPSCGAGIFLVLAFRKLFAARWEQDGKRPDTRTIQSILYRQVRGFDISESALRLAALSLYITAIELNASPRPPKSLKFPGKLQGVVLHNHRRPEEREVSDFVLGSLRPDLPNEFDHTFDLVIGNPPWSRLKSDTVEAKKINKAHNDRFTEITQEALVERGLQEVARTYANPDYNPDLPFVWRATKWAKTGGIIAMALPGRIFLKQTLTGTRAFNAILRGVEVTGILNGSNLSDTGVWPKMNQPFMLLFARNTVPSDSHRFYFVTPYFEKSLTDKGRIRIDFQSAQPLATADVIKESGLLKTLAIGTSLDVEVLRKINDLDWPKVKTYWEVEDGGRYSGLGYNLSPKQKQYPAGFMKGLPDFATPPDGEFMADLSSFPTFERPTAHMPRCKELYSQPLLIVPESPGGSKYAPKSWIVRKDTAFKKSYYGFSANGSKEATLEIAVLHLITHSGLFTYHVLLTSSRMGAERRTFLKENLDAFPFPVIDRLSEDQRQTALRLSSLLENRSTKPWDAVDDFIFDLYGLDKYDRQVVRDTLDVGAPFKDSRSRADNPPTKEERQLYYGEVREMLSPYFAITSETLSIDEIETANQDIACPWHFFRISASSAPRGLGRDEHKNLVGQIIVEANKTGCSGVTVHGDRYLLIGVIAQYRYWTLSRARLCGLDILRRHLDVFPVGRG